MTHILFQWILLQIQIACSGRKSSKLIRSVYLACCFGSFLFVCLFFLFLRLAVTSNDLWLVLWSQVSNICRFHRIKETSEYVYENSSKYFENHKNRLWKMKNRKKRVWLKIALKISQNHFVFHFLIKLKRADCARWHSR